MKIYLSLSREIQIQSVWTVTVTGNAHWDEEYKKKTGGEKHYSNPTTGTARATYNASTLPLNASIASATLTVDAWGMYTGGWLTINGKTAAYGALDNLTQDVKSLFVADANGRYQDFQIEFKWQALGGQGDEGTRISTAVIRSATIEIVCSEGQTEPAADESAYLAAALEPSRRIEPRGSITFPDGSRQPIDKNSIIGFEIEEGTSDGVLFGTATSSYLKLRLANANHEWHDGGAARGHRTLLGARVQMGIGLEVDGEMVWEPAGEYVVEEMEGEEHEAVFTVSGYDDMSNAMEAVWEDGQTYPRTLTQITSAIAQAAGLTLIGGLAANASVQITEKPDWGEECTLRQALAFVCAAGASYAQITREGKLRIRPTWTAVPNDTVVLTPEHYIKLQYDERAFVFNRLTVKPRKAEQDDEDLNVAVDASIEELPENTLHIDDNPLLVKGSNTNTTIMSGIKTALTGARWEALNTKWRGSPSVEIGRRISLTNTDGRNIVTDLMRQRMVWDNGFYAEAECRIDIAEVFTSSLVTGGGMLNTKKIAVDSILGDFMMTGSINGVKLKDGTVDADKIKAHDITANQIAANTITASEIAANAVTADEIAANAVTAAKIAADAVEAGKIKANAVTTEKLDAGAVTTAKLAAGAVTAEKIASGTITADKIDTNSLNAAVISAVRADLESASITNLQTDVANILKAHIGDADIDWASISNLVSEIAEIGKAQITTANINAANIDWANIQTLCTQIASIADASITSADIGYAQIKDASVQNLIARDAITDRYYIRKLAVDNAQLVQATVGELVIKASNGNYYRLDVATDGSVSPTRVTLTQAEIAAGVTSNGHGSIIETDLTVSDLSASNMKAINALIDKLTASRIDVGELFVRQAFITKLNTTDITGNGYLQIMVKNGINILPGYAGEKTGSRFQGIPVSGIFAGHEDESVMISFDVKGTAGDTLRVYAYQNSGLSIDIPQSSAYEYTLTGSYKRVITHAYVKQWEGTLNDGQIALYDYTANNPITIKRVKIEWGYSASPWSPCPDDVDDAIEEAQDTADSAEALAGSKAKITYSSSAPSDPAAGDMWNDTGTNELKIYNNGWKTVNRKITGTKMTMNADTGAIEIMADSTLNMASNKILNMSSGEMRITGGKVNVTGGSIDVASSTGLNIKNGGNLTVESGGTIDMSAATVKMGVVGSRNLLKNSGEPKTSTTYSVGDWDLGNDKPAEGEIVTVRVWATLGSDREWLGVWNSGGSVGIITRLTNNGDGTWSGTGPWVIQSSGGTAANTFVRLYAGPSSATSSCTVTRIKLERGQIATDWTAAPEDVDADIDAVSELIVGQGGISSRVAAVETAVETTIPGTYTTKTEFNQRAESIEASVEGLDFGVKNYLLNGACEFDSTAYWEVSGTAAYAPTTFVATTSGVIQNHKILYVDTSGKTGYTYIYNDSARNVLSAEAGEKITLSLKMFVSNDYLAVWGSDASVYLYADILDANGTTVQSLSGVTVTKENASENAGKLFGVKCAVTIPSGNARYGLRFNLRQYKAVRYFFTDAKIERGEYATDYAQEAAPTVKNSTVSLTKDAFTVAFNKRDVLKLNALAAEFDVDTLHCTGHISGDVLNSQSAESRTFSSIQAAQAYLNGLGKALEGKITITLTGSALQGTLNISGFYRAGAVGSNGIEIIFADGAILTGGIAIHNCTCGAIYIRAETASADSRLSRQIRLPSSSSNNTGIAIYNSRFVYIAYIGITGSSNATTSPRSTGIYAGNGAAVYVANCLIEKTYAAINPTISSIATVYDCIGGGGSVANYYGVLVATGGIGMLRGTIPSGTQATYGDTIGGLINRNTTVTATDSSGAAPAPSGDTAVSYTSSGAGACSWQTTNGSGGGFARDRGNVQITWSYYGYPRKGNDYNSGSDAYSFGLWFFSSTNLTAIKNALSGKNVSNVTATLTLKRNSGGNTSNNAFYLYYHNVTSGGSSSPASILTDTGCGALSCQVGKTVTITLSSDVKTALKNGTIKGFGIGSGINSSDGTNEMIFDASAQLDITYPS